MRKAIPTIAVVTLTAVLTMGAACERRPDPCTTAMPAPTAEQIAKVDRGLEVDESIEVQGSEQECVLVQNRDGQYVWLSEAQDG